MHKPKWLSAIGSPADFPPPDDALTEPNGLLAVGGSLHSEWLLDAYPKGIFPWYEAGQPILWWSPDPRAILLPHQLHVSRRLERRLRSSTLRLTADTAFAAVIDACAAPRRYTHETWITAQMRDAYVRLHELGWAHSFEAWSGETLVGGMYGIGIGEVFFGESMFMRQTDASKIVFVRAVEFLTQRGCQLIDCQVWSRHLQSLGATTIPRTEFLALLRRHCHPAGEPGPWQLAFKRATCAQL